MSSSQVIKYNRESFINIGRKLNSQINKDILDILNFIENKCKKTVKPTKVEKHTETDWRKSRPQIKPVNKTISDVIKSEITSLLNKLSKENYITISKKILDKCQQNLNHLSVFVEEIFSKAVSQPTYCPYYVQLFLDFSENGCNIDELILEKCEQFTSSINVNILGESAFNINDYDNFCMIVKKKQFKIGYSQFMGELFNKELVGSELILSFIDEMLVKIKCVCDDNLADESLENNINALCKLIITTYKNIPDIKIRLDKIKEIHKYKLNNKLRFKILDIIEMYS